MLTAIILTPSAWRTPCAAARLDQLWRDADDWVDRDEKFAMNTVFVASVDPTVDTLFDLPGHIILTMGCSEGFLILSVL